MSPSIWASTRNAPPRQCLLLRPTTIKTQATCQSTRLIPTRPAIATLTTSKTKTAEITTNVHSNNRFVNLLRSILPRIATGPMPNKKRSMSPSNDTICMATGLRSRIGCSLTGPWRKLNKNTHESTASCLNPILITTTTMTMTGPRPDMIQPLVRLPRQLGPPTGPRSQILTMVLAALQHLPSLQPHRVVGHLRRCMDPTRTHTRHTRPHAGHRTRPTGRCIPGVPMMVMISTTTAGATRG